MPFASLRAAKWVAIGRGCEAPAGVVAALIDAEGCADAAAAIDHMVIGVGSSDDATANVEACEAAAGGAVEIGERAVESGIDMAREG